MAWERCDVMRDYSGAFCRMEVGGKRILFNLHAQKAFRNAKFLVAYIDQEKRLLAFDILHSFEPGCSKISAKSRAASAIVVNTKLINRLVAAGLENGHKFVLKSSDERQVIFKW